MKRFKIYESRIKKWISENRTEFYLLMLILLIGAFLRLYRIGEYMTFLGDEGRDVIVVRRFLVDFDLMLVGPGTSIGNMYLGPLYYYMMAPFLLLFNFSPVGPAVMIALLGIVTIFFVWFIVRSVGSSEPLFIASVIASVFYFKNKNYWLAALWGVVAQLTKSPGILLFIAYSLFLVIPNLKKVAFTTFEKWIERLNLKKVYPIILIPLSLIGLFYFYGVRYGDYLAYFNSGDNIHLFFPPFQIFNYSAPWVGTFWLEEVIFVYLFGILGFIKLIRKKENLLAWFVGVFFFTILFVSHRDIIRYSLPIVPFLLIGWRDTLIKRDFKIAMAILIIPIYLFSLAYISQNVMQISNWAPLL